MGDMTKANTAEIRYGVSLLALLMTALFLVAQPVRAETSTNPLVTESFWKKVKQSENGLAMVRAAIDAGWDVNEKANNYNFRGTALHHAALAGMNEAIDFLLSKGANPNSVNHSEYTPLHFASTFAEDEDSLEIKAVSIKMIQTLLDAGANIDAVSDLGNSPLHRAFGSGSVETINYLIDAGASQTLLNVNADTPFEAIQLHRGRPFWGSSFYTDNKDRFTDNLRLVWGDWENGKIILEESINGKLTKIEQED